MLIEVDNEVFVEFWTKTFLVHYYANQLLTFCRFKPDVWQKQVSAGRNPTLPSPPQELSRIPYVTANYVVLL